MNTVYTIVVSILGSGLFSVIISAWISYTTNKRMKQVDFEYDYKRYFLEKRKEAYSRIENFFTQRKATFYPMLGEDMTIQGLKVRLINLQDIIDKLNFEVFNVWTSEKMMNRLSIYVFHLKNFEAAINKILIDAVDDPTYEIEKEDKVKLIVKENGLVGEAYHGIMITYFEDLMHLNNIDQFVEERTNLIQRFKTQLGI